MEVDSLAPTAISDLSSIHSTQSNSEGGNHMFGEADLSHIDLRVIPAGPYIVNICM